MKLTRSIICRMMLSCKTVCSIAVMLIVLRPNLSHADPQVTAPSALGQPACVHPNLDRFLAQAGTAIGVAGTDYPGSTAIFQTFRLASHYLQWMGVSWFGPDDGALFVLDCAGDRVAALHLGAFVQLRAGPVISGFGKTIEVVYISGNGTGDQERDVSLIAFSEKSIMVLWDHEASEVVSEPGVEPADYSDQYTWSYSESGTIIHVTGKRIVGEVADPDHGWAPHTTHDLLSETFCWQGAQRHYISRKDNSR